MWAGAVHHVPSPCSGQGGGQGFPKAAWGLHLPLPGLPPVKCLRNKKVPFSPPWLHTRGKELRPQFLFSDSEVAGIWAGVFCLAAATGTKAAVTGEGLLNLPMWALILWFTPASPFLCHTKGSPKYRSTRLAHRSPGDMGREWFPFTACYTTVCCWRHVTALEIFSTSPTDINWQIIFLV